MARQRFDGIPFLHEDTTNDLVGVKDPDGSEFYWQRVPRVGSFFDTTDQIIAANTAVPMTFNTVDISEGVFIEMGSCIRVNRAGLYNFQFSAQFASSAVQIRDVSVWFRKNGVNVHDSNSSVSIPASHGGVDGHLILALNFYIRLNTLDQVELVWSTTDALVVLAHIHPQTLPDRPSTPSVILTVNEVMA